MNSEDTSEQAILGSDVPDGIIEIETYDVAPVSNEEAIGNSPDGIIETEIYDISQSDDVVLSSNNTVGISVTPVSNKKNEARSMANQKPASSSTGENFEDWVVMPETSWPPPIFMKKNVTPKERFYLEYRWHSQWSFYDSKATQNKNTYYSLQRIVVIGSLIIPALISLNSTIARFITQFITNQNTAETETFVRIGVDAITVVISLAVAGAASLESLYKYGENWNSYRSAAEELQAEKNFYDMAAGPYAASPNPFATFVDRVEGIVANQNGKYFQAVQAQITKQTEENEEIISAFKDDDDEDYDYSLAESSSTATTTTSSEPEV